MAVFKVYGVPQTLTSTPPSWSEMDSALPLGLEGQGPGRAGTALTLTSQGLLALEKVGFRLKTRLPVWSFVPSLS